MSTGFIEIMKRAAMDANEANQPTDLRFGTVTSVNPLKVQVTNLFTIPETLLIVPRHLTDYTVKVSMDWDTEGIGNHTHTCPEGGTSTNGAHSHKILSSESKTLTIHNALKVGDKVALIRKQGGQVFYILDRI